MRLSELDYDLPEELIAQEPLARRDEARLLVLDRKSKTVEHSRFYKLVRHLRTGDLVVINDTRVLPARLFAQKESGGRVELLLVRRLDGPLEGRVEVPAGAWVALARTHRVLKENWRPGDHGGHQFDARSGVVGDNRRCGGFHRAIYSSGVSLQAGGCDAHEL